MIFSFSIDFAHAFFVLNFTYALNVEFVFVVITEINKIVDYHILGQLRCEMKNDDRMRHFHGGI